MGVVKLIVLLTFVVMLTKGCDLNEQKIQKYTMECAARNPTFMMEIAEHMQDPNIDFICRHDEDIVDMVMCLMDKMKNCVPPEARTMLSMILSRDRMLDGLNFACEHKNVLNSKCMDDHLQGFMQCYQTKLQTLISSAGIASLRTSNPKGVLCKVIRSEEECFRENKGHCTDSFVKIVIEMLEKFFPMSECPKVDSNNKVQTLLNSILVHGQPLKFKPGFYKNVNPNYIKY